MTSSSATDGSPGWDRIDNAVWILGGTAVISVTFSVAVSSMAMGAAFIALAAVLFRRGLGALPRTGLETAFLLYIAAEAISSAFSIDPADSFYNMKRVLLIGVAYVGAYSFRSESRIRSLLLILGVIGGIAAIGEAFSLRIVNGVLERPMMFQLPLTEGGIRMMIILLLLPMVMTTALPPYWRIGTALTLLPLLIGLVITQARSAWVAFVAGSIVIGVMKDRRVLAGLLLLLVLFMLFAPVDFRNRALSIADVREESNASRFQMISTGWEMFLDRPVFGWGDIGLRNYYITYVTPLTPGEGGHLHNNFMESLVTLGVPGFLAVIFLFWKIAALMFRTARNTDNGIFGQALGSGVLAAYAGFHVLGFFEYNFGDHEVMVLLWFMTGLAVAGAALAAPAGKGERP